MRSARAVRLKAAAGGDLERAVDLGHWMLATPARRAGSVAANQRAKRWKCGPPKRLDPRRAAERWRNAIGDRESARLRCRPADSSGMRAQTRAGIRWTMVPRKAGSGSAPSCFMFCKPQDVAGENLVWIGDPALDAGDAQFARPRLDRRTWLWAASPARTKARDRAPGPRRPKAAPARSWLRAPPP